MKYALKDALEDSRPLFERAGLKRREIDKLIQHVLRYSRRPPSPPLNRDFGQPISYRT